MGRTPLLQIKSVHGHLADPLTAYKDMLVGSPTTSPNKPLLMINNGGTVVTVTVHMLARALITMLHALGLHTSMYSHQSLRRGEATAWQVQLTWISRDMACGPMRPFGLTSWCRVWPFPQWPGFWRCCSSHSVGDMISSPGLPLVIYNYMLNSLVSLSVLLCLVLIYTPCLSWSCEV